MLAHITIEQLDKAGVEYDRAIPQEVWSRLSGMNHRNPVGHVVVVYQQTGVWGGLQATTAEGALMLAEYYK